MRTTLDLNRGWLFAKPEAKAKKVDLPHSWNAKDGQDGGNDYYRGTCRYTKTLKQKDLPATNVRRLTATSKESSVTSM